MPNVNEQLAGYARDLRTLKDRKDSLEEELKEVNEGIRKLAEETIPSYMTDNEIDKISVAGVGTLFTQMKVRAYVKKEDEERFHAWLREQGHDDMIRAYVFPATLAAFAKEQLENGVDLPDYLNAAKVEVAQLRRK